MTKGNAMVTAEADIRTEHAARYLARLCGHAGQMATAGRRPGHRQPGLGPVDHAGLPGRLAVRAEAADQESLRRIQDLLTARLQKFGRREHLTVHWQDLGG